MKQLLFLTLITVSCTTTKPFLSPIHEDMDKVCHFSEQLNAVRNDPAKLGPILKPNIKTAEVSGILRTLDKEGGDKLILLSQSLGYEKCDLITALKSDEPETKSH